VGHPLDFHFCLLFFFSIFQNIFRFFFLKTIFFFSLVFIFRIYKDIFVLLKFLGLFLSFVEFKRDIDAIDSLKDMLTIK
jgi:hypothetical protein